MRRKNLIFLVFSKGVNEVVRDCPEDVDLNLRNGTWVFREEEYKIGKSRLVPSYEDSGVVGVYDRNQIRHLNSMISALEEKTRKISSYDMD